jgi:putative molybdopterin biosynthesis protein
VTTETSQLRPNRSFLTPQEVSELLRVSVYTVRRWIKQGDLPAYRVGRSWRISASALDEWLEQHQSDRLS